MISEMDASSLLHMSPQPHHRHVGHLPTGKLSVGIGLDNRL
jgi:hypothetical protein